ncbi:AbrB/MazE/SpoVT family DNA-binding domain-containing protein [Desulfotomaculum sp. 1211_IL3151]|uniref:AbrB/MazE/SpoVT family DNA-binding domain-containing protein n=1 Tax=Desulfotomaculum sp. 1211_IL3151 TaxID=3084055 RepID=UPI002FDA97A2
MDSRINEHGQLLLPLEVGKLLNLQNDDLLKVTIESNYILLTLENIETKEDGVEKILDNLIHEGILIDIK